jgi:glycosyltransferase involved in cell wall biosynthesis
MKASVIICTYNRSTTLEASLDSIIKQEFPVEQFDIVVVDNNSSDDTKAIIEKIAASSPVKITYLFEVNQGLSYARNAGIKSASGEILAFTDDDINAESTWLGNLVAVFNTPEVACAGGPLKPVWPSERPDWLTDDMLPAIAISEFPSARNSGEFKGPDYPWGANIAFRKEVFAHTGMFPTNLGRIGTSLLSNEELEICRRIEARGLRICFAPNAVIHHKIAPERLAKVWFLHRYYYQGRSDALLDMATGIDIYKRFIQLVKSMAWRRLKNENAFFHACLHRSVLGYFHQLILPPDEKRVSYRTLRAVEAFINGMTVATKEKDKKIQELQKYINEKHQDLSKYAEIVLVKNQSLNDLERIKSEQSQRLDLLEAQVNQNHEKMKELSKYIDERQLYLDGHSNFYQEKDQQLTNLERIQAEQTLEIENLNSVIIFLKERIANKDTRLQALEIIAANAQKHLTDQYNSASKLQRIIINAQNQLSQQGQRLYTLENTLSAKDEIIAQLTIRFDVENIRLLSKSESATKEHYESVRDLNNKIDEMRDSWSWKITTPLRKLTDLALKLIGK